MFHLQRMLIGKMTAAIAKGCAETSAISGLRALT